MSYSKSKNKKKKKSMRRNKKAGFVKKEHLNEAAKGAKHIGNSILGPITNMGNAVVSAVSTGPGKLFSEGKKAEEKTLHMGKNLGKGIKHTTMGVANKGMGIANKGMGVASKGLKKTVKGTNKVGRRVVNVGHSTTSKVGKMVGGSGRCCFKAKTCNSRKRKGNRTRNIKSGKCCIPVKSKSCGAKTKKHKKHKKSRQSGGG